MDRLPTLQFGVAVLAALAGCAHVAYSPRGTPPPASAPARPAPGRYEVRSGGDAQTVAELRAAPPPAQTELADSQSPGGDEHVLAAKGFVHVGDGYHAGVDAEARSWLLQKAREVGADKSLVYVLPATADTPEPSLHAAYYVRFKLPFGASFRDLTADEHDNLGATGVQIGAVIGGSPAADANLRVGDFVLKFNGETIRDRAGFQQLLRTHMGKRVTLTISRDGTLSQRLLRLGVLAGEAGA
ncbi:MAG: PDZ domain-containing protein, partial [Rudaea sp.]|nr:PDZ domain-containing protein [Rudaea sp.]